MELPPATTPIKERVKTEEKKYSKIEEKTDELKYEKPVSHFTPSENNSFASSSSVIPESMKMQDDDEDLYLSPSDVVFEDYISDNDFEEF